MPQSSSPALSCQCPDALHAPGILLTPSTVAPSVLPTNANHHAHAPSDAEPTAREDAGAPSGRLPIHAGRRSTASSLRARCSRPQAVARIPRSGAAAGPSLPPYLRNIHEGVRPRRCIRQAAQPARKLLPVSLLEKRVDSYALHGLRMVLVPALSPLTQDALIGSHTDFTYAGTADAGPPGHCLSVRCGQYVTG